MHAERLTAAAREVAQMRRRIAGDPALRRWSHAVKDWQSARLARTHADLLASERYHVAAHFFLEELYGAKDFAQRDSELERVLPLVTRMLPDAALATLADAVELDALSESLDEAVAAGLKTDDPERIDEASYADAYRAAAPRERRLHQLDLVLGIGRSLDRLVRMPLLGGMLAAMAGPARLAGMATMHEFLSDGYSAFRALGGASEFLQRIDGRERTILEDLYGGVRTGWTLTTQA
jgi:hypothetical protein